MGHPLRDRDPSKFRLITVRTVRGEMWLTPNGKIKRMIGGVIARYQEMYGIEIYAYYVLSNHIHLLIRAPGGNTDQFAENINREISRRINKKHNRSGSLWGRRYSDQEILEEDDVVEALLYITTNSTKHGLLGDPRKWKGLHCYDHLLDEKDRTFSFTHFSKRTPEGIPYSTTHRLKLSVIPHFSSLTKSKRRIKLLRLLSSKLKDLKAQRGSKPFMEHTAIEKQIPGEVPVDMKKTPRPSCYSKCSKAIKNYLAERKLLLERYAEASIQFRLGNLSTSFPKFTFKPPLHRYPSRYLQDKVVNFCL